MRMVDGGWETYGFANIHLLALILRRKCYSDNTQRLVQRQNPEQQECSEMANDSIMLLTTRSGL